MRKFILLAGISLSLYGVVYALDMDRHATYTEGKEGKEQCKTFAGSDDNLGHCQEWCNEFRAAHPDAACVCSESKCDS